MGTAMHNAAPLGVPTGGAKSVPDDTSTAPQVACLVGAQANRLLSEPRFSGRVLAVMSKATYIETAAGEVFGVSPPSQPAHTRMVSSDLDSVGLYPGTVAWMDGDRLLFENGAASRLGTAPVWEGPSVEQGQEIHLRELSLGFDRVVEASLASHQGENLGLALTLVAGQVQSQEPFLCRTSSPFVAAAMAPVQGVMDACWQGRLDKALLEAKALIGLGTGLTPSGDDFVGGLLFTAWHLGRAYPSRCPWDGEHVGELVAGWEGLTNRISYAFLQDFAQGQGPRPLHDLMAALLTGADASETMAHVHLAAAIGSSSGWDMLTGLLTGMLLAVGCDWSGEV